MTAPKQYIAFDSENYEWHTSGDLEAVKYDILEYLSERDYEYAYDIKVHELGKEIKFTFDREPHIEFKVA